MNISTKQIKTAIVILNWNGRNYLEQFLPSVIQHSTLPYSEIYVADNGSDDDSVKFLKEKYPQINLILFDKNHGFTGGYNKALKQIEAEYYVLLNSDVELTENWINPIIELMDSDNKIAAASPKLKAYHDKSKFEYAGASGGFIDKFGYPFCKGRIISKTETDSGQYDEITEVFWASGACLFVRADLYHKFKGLDEDFFAHMEEIDLCWRFKNAGYKIINYNLSEVYHVGGGALPKENPFKIYLNFRNNLLLLLKNLPSDKVFSVIFMRMILDSLSAFIYLISGKFSFFTAVIKAHIAFYGLIGKFRKKRKSLKHKKSHTEIYNKSIVIDFFIRKKRKFSDLKIKQSLKKN